MSFFGLKIGGDPNYWQVLGWLHPLENWHFDPKVMGVDGSDDFPDSNLEWFLGSIVPTGSMYGTFTYIWLISMIHVIR